jgi:PII interaction protein X
VGAQQPVAFNGHSSLWLVSAERYLSHPTFGMLYRVAPAGENRDLFATLYAQRIFFLVTLQAKGATFEVIPLTDARHFAEQNLARARREGQMELARWRQLFDQTFL